MEHDSSQRCNGSKPLDQTPRLEGSMVLVLEVCPCVPGLTGIRELELIG